MGMTPEREKEIRKIAGRDGQTWRSSAVSLVALNDVIDELDELRGKVLAFRDHLLAERNAAHSRVTYRDVVSRTVRDSFSLLLNRGFELGLFESEKKVPEKPYIKPAMGFGASGLPEGFNDPVVQHFHDDPVFYANCPACVAGHAGVFNGKA